MKTTEFEEKVLALSSHYSIVDTGEFLFIQHDEHTVLSVSKNIPYEVSTFMDNFTDQLPFSHKLYMITSEYSMTPIKDRETKYGLYNPNTHDWLKAVNAGTSYDLARYKETGRQRNNYRLESDYTPHKLSENMIAYFEHMLNYEKREIK